MFTKETEEISNKGPPHPAMGSIDVTTAGIIGLLHSLDVHKAFGLNEICTMRFLNETAAFTAPVLKIIII